MRFWGINAIGPSQAMACRHRRRSLLCRVKLALAGRIAATDDHDMIIWRMPAHCLLDAADALAGGAAPSKVSSIRSPHFADKTDKAFRFSYEEAGHR